MLAQDTCQMQKSSKWVCSTFNILHELSSDRRKPGQFLSFTYKTTNSTKGPQLVKNFAFMKPYNNIFNYINLICWQTSALDLGSKNEITFHILQLRWQISALDLSSKYKIFIFLNNATFFLLLHPYYLCSNSFSNSFFHPPGAKSTRIHPNPKRA